MPMSVEELRKHHRSMELGLGIIVFMILMSLVVSMYLGFAAR